MTLRELREQNGKSRAEVAAALGVTVMAVSNYENGYRQISLSQVLDLAHLFEEIAEEVIKAQLNSCRKDQSNNQMKDQEHGTFSPTRRS